MSGTVAERKRLFPVNAANIRNGHLYVSKHFDFFPDDVFGANDKSSLGQQIEIELAGMNCTFKTDIATDRDGKPRRFFRERKNFAAFFAHHKIQPGDVLAMERIGTRKYRLYPFHNTKVRSTDWHRWLESPLTTDRPTVLELFAGCGGMGLGFKQAGYECVLAVEWDEAASRTLSANITERVAQCAVEEVTTFPKADVVIGGPPCQGFSNLGERVPYDPRRQLWREYLRAIEQAEPRAFVMENVPPLLSSQEFVEIKKSAEKLGFNVVSGVLNAADYGVPQARKRAIVIGLKGYTPSLPERTHAKPASSKSAFSPLKPWLTVRDAIGDLPLEPSGKDWHIGRNPTTLSLQRYACIPEGGNRWDLPVHLTPECWKKKKSGGTDLFGRLFWDRPSVTIRTEFYKPEKGRYLHPVANRPITHREAARLQGFPDDFVFCGSKIEVGRQIGNAVPPPLAFIIAKHVATMLVAETA